MRSLYSRLAVTLVAILLALGSLLFLLHLASANRLLQQTQQDLHRNLAAQLIKDALPMEDGTIDQSALEQIFHMLMVVNPAIEVYLLDPHGKILAYSAPSGAVIRETVDLEPIDEFLERRSNLPILGDDPRHERRRKIFSAAEVRPHDALEGYLYVILAGERYESELQMLAGSHTLRLAASAAAAALIFFLATGLLSFAWITRRLRRLAAAVRSLRERDFAAGGGLADQIPSGTPKDEIGELEAGFREMTERLSLYVQELEKTDSLRRELVANVSHDLRTPLTSMRGYLETLRVKAAELSEAERREYLDTALRHTERLSTLIEELFELAKLESTTLEPEREPFSLAELVQDSVQQFQMRAAEEGLSLEAVLPGAPTVVLGDVGLLARVLENLIHNALRHAGTDGSVAVALEVEGGEARLHVEDDGPGIAPEDLPLVFERFFRRPRQPGDGAGLGLAIAHRIVALHGGELKAENRAGGGARFSFTLPLAPSR